MKTRLWGALAGIVVLALVALTVTACGGGSKVTASTAVEVTTLAGKAGVHGSAAARFNWPSGIACDVAGNLYLTDQTTIRKITWSH